MERSLYRLARRLLRPGCSLHGFVPLAVAGLSACAGASLPDPEQAALAHARALQEGDAGALHASLSDEDQQRYRVEDVARLLRETKAELTASAKQLRAARRRGVTAVVVFEHGERAELVEERGVFRLSASGLLPSGATSPVGALRELRLALLRGAMGSLGAVLTDEARRELERGLAALIEDLGHAEALDIQVDGDKARVELPSGRLVLLSKQGAVWRIEDFD